MILVHTVGPRGSLHTAGLVPRRGIPHVAFGPRVGILQVGTRPCPWVFRTLSLTGTGGSPVGTSSPPLLTLSNALNVVASISTPTAVNSPFKAIVGRNSPRHQELNVHSQCSNMLGRTSGGMFDPDGALVGKCSPSLPVNESASEQTLADNLCAPNASVFICTYEDQSWAFDRLESCRLTGQCRLDHLTLVPSSK